MEEQSIIDATQEELLEEVAAYAAVEYQVPANAITSGDVVEAMKSQGVDMTTPQALTILQQMVKKGLLKRRLVNRRWYFFKENENNGS